MLDLILRQALAAFCCGMAIPRAEGDHGAHRGCICLYYQIGGSLTSIARGDIAAFSHIAAVLPPEALETENLPEALLPPEQSRQARGCRLSIEADRIRGTVQLPAKGKTPEKRVSFVWWKDCILFVDPDGVARTCIDRIHAMRPHHADGADDLLMDFFLALVQEDLSELQSLEDGLSALEQAVLCEKTEKFINRISVVRRELNQRSRYYTQLTDMAATIQENAGELLDACSQSRLQYVMRRLNRLHDETQMLREYASQVSSEYQAQVDIAQNRIMKLLTIVTTVFMPLSLITGWYGMNFANMPELEWEYGYPAAVALSVLVVGGCMLYFRRKHFL